MKDVVDIHVILNEKYINPKVDIHTKERTAQVESIIYAIEKASENDFPMILGYDEKQAQLLSQRDIIRAYTEHRKVYIQTEQGLYLSKKPLAVLECELNEERFVRISQSEIINLYKVKCLDMAVSGTIGIEFDNGTKSWVARSRMKAIRALLKK